MTTTALEGAWRGLRSRPLVACMLAGSMAGLSMPPLYLLPGLLGFAVLAGVLSPEIRAGRAFVAGTLFGFGYFAVGLYWIAIAFFVDAERFGALAVPAVAGLSLAMGATWGLGTLVVARLSLKSNLARAVALGLAWAVLELVRGELLFQFPWNPVAAAWTITDATMQPIAWIGSFGLGALTVAFASSARPNARAILPTIALPLALFAAGEARFRSVSPGPSPGVELRLVQANIPQSLKWDLELRRRWFERHLELSSRPRATPADILIWPESAVPFQVEAEPVVRELIARVTPPEAVALVGGNQYETEQGPPVAHNSVFALGFDRRILARYDKVDLVPFGEFLPFRGLLTRIGLEKLTPGAFDFEPGAGRTVLELPKLPSPSPLVCYEAIFPNRAAPLAPRPGWLLNVTNDAWFGISSGPYQHLAMARTRAVEEGLPLVRAANSGISVVTDAFGRVMVRLPLDTIGTIDTVLPPPLTEPSFARRAGWVLVVAFLGGGALCVAAIERRARRH